MRKALFLIASMLSIVCSAPLVGQEVKVGKVSYYSDKFHGKKTANGQIFDKNKLTAASPLKPGTTIPEFAFGTKLKVTNLSNGKSVVVIINDTGSFGKYGRVLDLSEKAFSDIAELKKGVVKVKVERL